MSINKKRWYRSRRFLVALSIVAGIAVGNPAVFTPVIGAYCAVEACDE